MSTKGNTIHLNFIIGTRWPLTHTNTASFKEQHSIPLILSMYVFGSQQAPHES